ncbi:hypothetical protein AaE_001707 [Aphanomyces astaci]|uniref:Uncharacterized protein n=1 Tax=Aphanomyces astaci TaxID=112090 RepID=A0A6A5AVX9_APHAT|nr:hypothetical protein AaE_001707 [Aphanomyces astaci]
MVNEYRSSVDEGHVGQSPVYSLSVRMNPVVTPLQRLKQGSPDEYSAWAIARCGLIQHIATRTYGYLDEAILAPLEISQVVVWDDTHKDAQIGDYGAGGRKTQVRFPRDADGMFDPDGSIGPEKSYLNTKFNQQARFSIGCAIVELHNGATMGCRCTPFVYSG